MLERSWKAACATDQTFRCWIEHCHLPAWVVAFQPFVGHSILCRNIACVSNGTLIHCIVSHKQLSRAPLNISNSSQLLIPSNCIPMFQGPTWWRLPWLPVDQAQHIGQTDDDALQDLFDVTAHQVHHAWSSCSSEKGWSKEEHCRNQWRRGFGISLIEGTWTLHNVQLTRSPRPIWPTREASSASTRDPGLLGAARARPRWGSAAHKRSLDHFAEI